jgi:hypothetical protein
MRAFFLLAPLIAVLTSCGVTTGVKPTEGAAIGGKKYTKVVVRDFAYRGAADQARGAASSQTFPNSISSEVTKTGAYSAVARGGKTDANTLVIEGEVTRFVEGNAALRALVGLGAGSSYFDANVRFIDGSSGKVVGTMNADKNSWVLGGGLAAGQTVENFMNGAAKKVGQESVKFSTQGASR